MSRPDRKELEVAVLGAAGFAGGELLRLLALHPAVTRTRAFSRSHAGKPIGSVHPPMAHVAPAAVFEEGAPRDAAKGADVVFLALDHGESQRRMGEVLDQRPRLVIDLAADFRIADRTRYEAFYPPHACFELAPSFAYGLADVRGAALAEHARIAAPGCFATAALLALWPLATRAELDGPAACFAVTGSSGAGTTPRPTAHHPFRDGNVFAYQLQGHRHEAEIGEQLAGWSEGRVSCRLLAHAGPFVRGIHATVHARLRRPVPDPLALYRQAYEGRPFVHVEDTPPGLHAVVGTNFAHLHAVPREDGREVVVTAVLDNLLKGAAGQAVQAMNLALGLDERAGLTWPGVHPC